MNDKPVQFECRGQPLIGMVHGVSGAPEVGVLMAVAGGPQYRIGGARQLVLWARAISAQGFPVFRFDFRGMGDSYGDYPDFEDVDDDLRAALDCFFAQVPSLKHVVLWGECNACSAALFYAHKDERVKGLVMLNPWVRTEEGQAQTIIKHYYLQRLMQRSFWLKVLRLEFDFAGSLRSALELVGRAKGEGRGGEQAAGDAAANQRSLPERMLTGLSRFKGTIMLVMSGRDFIANEFDELLNNAPAWRQQLTAHGTVRHDLEFADHTFSTAQWRDQVAAWGIVWLTQLQASLAGGHQSTALHPVRKRA
jgi:uncharacterized protein